jgi:hypothetical protein
MGKNVFSYAGNSLSYTNPRERKTIGDLCQIIASFYGGTFLGDFTEAGSVEGVCVPYSTLLATDAARLGIAEESLFGGIVPVSYMRTKAIAHGLVPGYMSLPNGWIHEFPLMTEAFVLPGYTVFCKEDARSAYRLLASQNLSVRAKLTLAAGSGGQFPLTCVEELEPVFDFISQEDFAECGLVLESNMKSEGLVTKSIGTAILGGTRISYFGTQRDTCHPSGSGITYGGSDLFVVKGDFSNLLRYAPDPATRLAICQAQSFDSATNLLGIIATRRNYDVIQGIDALGRICSGVLEQSWRIGGASGPEVVAIQAFLQDETLEAVEASSHVQFHEILIPEGAVVHFADNPLGFSEAAFTVVTKTYHRM